LRRTFHFIIFVILTGIGLWMGWRFSQPEPVSVVLAEVHRGPVESTVANTRAGTVKACRRSWLAPATGGQVSALPVKEGDRVSAGSLLMAIWNEDLKAKAKLAQSEVTAASARAQEACLNAEVAEREAARLSRLKRQHLVSEEQVDRATTEAKARRAACAGARAAVEVARARFAAARAELEKTTLKAPFAGIVAEVTAEIGEFVTPSPPGIPTPPAIDLIDDRCLYVTAPIDEVDAPAVQVGMPACVSLDAFPNRICNGKVQRIAPYVLDREKQARTVEVEIEFSDTRDTERLLPGYSADVEIVLARKSQVLRLPTEAIFEGDRVLIFNTAKQQLEERRFEPGLSNWQYTEVRSGLDTGVRVVVSIDREGVQSGAFAIPEPEAARAPGPS
jgi:HlyD family secretion protein